MNLMRYLPNIMWFSIKTFLLLLTTIQVSSGVSPCPTLQTQSNLNLTEYQRASWYIQEQQVNGYQPVDSLYCVTATYNQSGHEHVPFFQGEVISVFNYCNKGKVNGPSTTSQNPRTQLCARVLNTSESSRLLVAPCLLPNALGGNYWILAAGPEPHHYTWAIIIAGPPTVKYVDGCSTAEKGVNGAGLWLFHRSPVAPSGDLLQMRHILRSQGIAISRLHPVPQDGCNYRNAYLKM